MRKNFFNQQELKIQKIGKFYESELNLGNKENIENIGLGDLDNIIANFINSEKNRKANYFKIILPFLKEDIKEEEKNLLLVICSFFFSHITSDKDLKREARMSVPNFLKHSLETVSGIALRDIVNKRIKYSLFAIEFFDKNEEFITSVF